MRTLRCKCGEAIMWTTDSPRDCQGCKKCNTTYAGHPDNHKELQPHTWKIMYEQNTGKPYKRCEKCYAVDEESYVEARKKTNCSCDAEVIGSYARCPEHSPDEEEIVVGEVVEKKPIPKNLEEAIARLITDNEGIDIPKDENKFIGQFHHQVGMWMRNEWGLWTGSELQTWFKERGIHHADDMSGIIMSSFHRRINGKEIKLDEQIKHYRKYWDKVDPKINQGKM
jgi:hypothetical protein